MPHGSIFAWKSASLCRLHGRDRRGCWLWSNSGNFRAKEFVSVLPVPLHRSHVQGGRGIGTIDVIQIEGNAEGKTQSNVGRRLRPCRLLPDAWRSFHCGNSARVLKVNERQRFVLPYAILIAGLSGLLNHPRGAVRSGRQRISGQPGVTVVALLPTPSYWVPQAKVLPAKGPGTESAPAVSWLRLFGPERWLQKVMAADANEDCVRHSGCLQRW